MQPTLGCIPRLAAQGLINYILLPSGAPAPILHQHADDTSVHVRMRADARTVIEGLMQVLCQATGSLVQPIKSQGLGETCAPDGVPPFSGACPLTGVLFVAGNTPITHVGVLVGPCRSCSGRLRCAS